MFGNAPPTSFDLCFRVLGIPVRVHPLFWLIMALLGEPTLQAHGAVGLLIWVACGFVSILFHELGHAVAACYFRSWSTINLIAFGGFATLNPVPRFAWQRLVVTASGPAVNFALVGLMIGISLTLKSAEVAVPLPLDLAITYLFWQNLCWGIFNLFPIWPLDGGQMFRELCAIFGSRKSDIITHMVSMCVAGFFTLWGILTITGNRSPFVESLFFGFQPTMFSTIFFAMFTFENYQLYEYHRNLRRGYSFYDDDTPPWRR